jgi:hypothetical protein
MTTRYDYMEESNVSDIDGQVYYDPLSINYSNLSLSEVPTPQRVNASDIQKFWIYMYNNYGLESMDDILLSLNGIGYVGELEPGSVIFNISLNDMKKCVSSEN